MYIRLYLIFTITHNMSVQDHEHITCRTRVVLYRIGMDYISSAVQTFVERTALS